MFDGAADITVQMHSEVNFEGSLGIALRGAKVNDVARWDPKLIVLEFSEYGLRNAFTTPNEMGFPDLMAAARGEK